MAITTGAGLMTYQAKEVLNKVLNTSNDSLQVDIVDATGVSITATSGSEYADDAAFTLGSDKGTMIMGFAGTQSVNADDAAALACDTDGALHIADGGNSITIDGSVTADLGSNNDVKIESGQVKSGAIASGAIASGAVASGAVVSGAVVDGAVVTLGAKADAKSTATDTTSITAMQVLKQISASVQETATDTGTIDSDTDAIKTAVQLIDNSIFADNAGFTLSSSSVNVAGGVYQSGTPGSLGDNDAGAVLLNETSGQMVELMASNASIGTVDLGSTDNAVLDAMVVDLAAMEALLITIDSDTDAIKTAVEILDDWDDSDYANVNMNIAGSDVAAGNAVPTTHSVTGIVDGLKVVTTAGTDVALSTSTACKKVDIQAQTDNTSVIAVGATGVDATVATGTGVILNAGDVYSLEIDNLNDVYIDSLVDGEGVRFTYFT